MENNFEQTNRTDNEQWTEEKKIFLKSFQTSLYFILINTVQQFAKSRNIMTHSGERNGVFFK